MTEHSAIPLRTVASGLERLERSGWVPRHRHRDAYALIAVDGVFEQVSYAGRVVARPGDLLVQPTLDCHANRALSEHVRVLRLPWRFELGTGGADALRDVAAETGFADQAHMSRCVLHMTGATPARWRTVSRGNP